MFSRLACFFARLFAVVPARGASRRSINVREVGYTAASSAMVAALITFLQIVLDAALQLPLDDRTIAVISALGAAVIAVLQLYLRFNQEDEPDRPVSPKYPDKPVIGGSTPEGDETA